MSDITPIGFLCGTLFLSAFVGFILSLINELTAGHGKSVGNFIVNCGTIFIIALIIIWAFVGLIAGIFWAGGLQ